MSELQTVVSDAEIATPDELLQRASALTSVVRERSIQANNERQLPAETVDDLKRAGLIRVVQPVRFGGMGHDLEVVADTSMAIARGCGASGWMASFWAIHQFMVGWFPEQAQEDYWADVSEHAVLDRAGLQVDGARGGQGRIADLRPDQLLERRRLRRVGARAHSEGDVPRPARRFRDLRRLAGVRASRNRQQGDRDRKRVRPRASDRQQRPAFPRDLPRRRDVRIAVVPGCQPADGGAQPLHPCADDRDGPRGARSVRPARPLPV